MYIRTLACGEFSTSTTWTTHFYFPYRDLSLFTLVDKLLNLPPVLLSTAREQQEHRRLQPDSQ